MRNAIITLETILFYIMATIMIVGGVALYNGMEFAWICFKAWGVILIVTAALREIEVIMYGRG